jgi:hypothetical protein
MGGLPLELLSKHSLTIGFAPYAERVRRILSLRIDVRTSLIRERTYRLVR